MIAAEEPPGSEREEESSSSNSKKVNLTQLQTSQELSQGEVNFKGSAPSAISQQQQLQLQVSLSSNSNDASSASSSFQLHQQDPERRYRPQKFCAVCGDKAIACNFNAVTCESCKAFFRRNAFKEQRLKCLFDNRCIIDRVTRRFCSKCRLLKCFEIGMKREWILTDEQKQIKRVKIMQNKQSKQQQQRQQQSVLSASLSSKSPSLAATSCDESLSSSHQQHRHQHQHQYIATTQAAAARSGHDKLADLSCADELECCDQQGAYNDYATGKDRRPQRQAAAKVETRDATTSCDDPFELAGSFDAAGQPLHCSLASQCRFCSLKLTGCFPRNLQPQAPPTQTSALNQFSGNQPFDTSSSSNTSNQYQHQAAGSSALPQHGRLATIYGPTSHQQQQQQQQAQSHMQPNSNTCSSCPPTPKHLMRSNSVASNINQQHQQHVAQPTDSVPSFILSQSAPGCCSLGHKSTGLENQNLSAAGLSVKGENYLVWSDQIHSTRESNECRNN